LGNSPAIACIYLLDMYGVLAISPQNNLHSTLERT
jgi:hypothetical protein